MFNLHVKFNLGGGGSFSTIPTGATNMARKAPVSFRLRKDEVLERLQDGKVLTRYKSHCGSGPSWSCGGDLVNKGAANAIFNSGIVEVSEKTTSYTSYRLKPNMHRGFYSEVAMADGMHQLCYRFGDGKSVSLAVFAYPDGRSSFTIHTLLERYKSRSRDELIVVLSHLAISIKVQDKIIADLFPAVEDITVSVGLGKSGSLK